MQLQCLDFTSLAVVWGGGKICTPNNTGTPRFSDLPTALSTIDIEGNEKEDSIVKADEKNGQSLFHAKTLNSGMNNEKSFQNTNEQGKSECLIKKEHCDDHRGVVPGGAMASPVFGRSVNPISTGGGQIMPTITTGTPGFSDLPTTLQNIS